MTNVTLPFLNFRGVRLRWSFFALTPHIFWRRLYSGEAQRLCFQRPCRHWLISGKYWAGVRRTNAHSSRLTAAAVCLTAAEVPPNPQRDKAAGNSFFDRCCCSGKTAIHRYFPSYKYLNAFMKIHFNFPVFAVKQGPAGWRWRNNFALFRMPAQS